MHKVFVFGTLKEGFPNYKTNKGTRFRGDFVTENNYSLYLVGERYSPWLVLDSNSETPVIGQVFEVSNDAISAMDKLERINEPDGYRKVIFAVTCLETGEDFNVVAYGKPLEMLDTSTIKLELESEYNIEHAKLYRHRYS
ncbi:gamma-glutamylcyclotransferase [uncultured Vibrio sp.]|uniref:gamma-glutamylcyclotransferase family protein n=1 Tax=uncultured Vibrio sp. TaxID=114054 RepID=UPI0025E0F52C|nr:gamma-glutamylcyclotransferase family protein [uncultured Vibrio sp.]